MMKGRSSRRIIALAVVCGLIGPASAAPVVWTDWTSATAGTPGSASGVITLPDSSTIGVSYSGEITFAQTAGGTFYWTYPTTYESAAVDNAPTTSDIIALTGGNQSITNTITFAQPVTDPVMTILSLGRYGTNVQYVFNAPFDVLSSGPGYWDGGGLGTLTELPGNVLSGYEGHGTIQFLGTFSSISWTCSTSEYWHGFTVGIPIPAPGAILLGGLGTCLVAALRRRKMF